MTPILPLLLAFTQPAEAFAPSPLTDVGLLPDPSTTTLPKSVPEALPKSVPTSNNLASRIFSRVVGEVEERIVTKSVQPPKSALAYAGVVALLAVGAGVYLSWRNSFYIPADSNHGPAPDFSKSPLGFNLLPSPMTASPLGDDSISISSPAEDYQAKQDSLKAWGDRNFKIALLQNMIRILELAGIGGAALGQLKTQLQELESQAVATDGGGNRASANSDAISKLAATAKDSDDKFSNEVRFQAACQLARIAYNNPDAHVCDLALIEFNQLASYVRARAVNELHFTVALSTDHDKKLEALSTLVAIAQNDQSLTVKSSARAALESLAKNPYTDATIKEMVEEGLDKLTATSKAPAKK